MGAHKNELTDIHALLSTLQHQPFEGEGAHWPSSKRRHATWLPLPLHSGLVQASGSCLVNGSP